MQYQNVFAGSALMTGWVSLDHDFDEGMDRLICAAGLIRCRRDSSSGWASTAYMAAPAVRGIEAQE